jgi:ribosomal protein L37AE/L43A
MNIVKTNRYPFEGPECPQCGAALDDAVDLNDYSMIWKCWVCGFTSHRGADEQYRMEDFAGMAGLPCKPDAQ